MKKIKINDLEPGMVIAKQVKTSDGITLLSTGVELTPDYIKSLRDRGFPAVYIKDERFANIRPEPVVKEKNKSEIEAVVKNAMENIKFGKKIDYKKIRRASELLIQELIENKNLAVNLNSIRSYSEYTFGHSVNVAILSTLIGLDYGYNVKKLKDLSIGALLHDVGKIKIDRAIILKPDKLTKKEFERVRKHTIEGYKALNEVTEISYMSSHVAYQHHERLDGSGYPQGLTGDQIHIFAQIVAVADIYDAITTDRVYSNSIPTYQAIKALKLEADENRVNKDFVNILLKFIAPYPVGTIVKLSNGKEGIVIRNNKSDLSLPVIRLVTKKGQKRLDSFYEIDLSKSSDLEIEKVIKELS